MDGRPEPTVRCREPRNTWRGSNVLLVAAVALWLVPTDAVAQSPDTCVFVCAPALKIEPTVTLESLGRRPRVEVDGVIERVKRDTVFELIFALDVPTEIPRLGFTLEAIFVPFGTTDVNPFTGATAGEAGRMHIRDNGIEVEAEVNFSLLEEEQTGGWLSSHVDLVDKFSPAATSRAGSVYSHKLNFEWDTAVHVFNWLPDGHWLRHLEGEVSLDYVATGLPRAGDLIDGTRFLDDHSPWSLSFVFVVPLVPLVP